MFNIKISEEVKHALENNIPVVALESTIISHGMPYPRNVETALNVEQIIRDNGAVPATIGIINGLPIVGMSNDEIEEFGKKKGILKVSRRDLPYVISKELWGATTVATTMILADLAGIKVFVTGGIGGVHREFNETMDVSADLNELARTNVNVICAGVKAILDLPRTMEYLETMGVLVLGYKSDYLPNFYTPASDIKLNYKAESPIEIAKMIKAKEDYNLTGGILITNPIKKEDAIDEKEINDAINIALLDAHKNNIEGKDITPFLLKRIVELTNGDSLESNIKLVYNNAELGAKIAKEYCLLTSK